MLKLGRYSHVGLLCSGLVLPAWAGGCKTPRDGRQTKLPNESSENFGDAAVEIPADRLPELASSLGLTAESLTGLLNRDKSLKAFKNSKLFYVCPTLDDLSKSLNMTRPDLDPNRAAAAALTPGELVNAVTPAQAFTLHSRPNAVKKIFLDFDGHETVGTVWNELVQRDTIVTPPYDRDGNISSFSQEELDNIFYMWRSVAEDYAPFDVDITTQDPGDAVLAGNGVRVAVGGSNSDWLGRSVAGVAAIGLFGDKYYSPAFVFPAQLASGLPKYVWEAISHETGHTLGLFHDGYTDLGEYYGGQGNWAPIMGAAYFKEITQFDRGEYTGANNAQDDFVTINGFLPYIPDNAGVSFASATTLKVPTMNRLGSISRRANQAYFKFTSRAGILNLKAQGVPLWLTYNQSNINLSMTLYNSSQKVLTRSVITKPGDTATFSYNIPTNGTYYVSIDGIGVGDPTVDGYSDFGSVGSYTLNLAANVAPVALASAKPTSGKAPLAVSFSSAGSQDPDGTIVGYAWNFGDGTTSTEQNPSKTYKTKGTRSVTLKVTDNSGATSVKSLSIKVY